MTVSSFSSSVSIRWLTRPSSSDRSCLTKPILSQVRRLDRQHTASNLQVGLRLSYAFIMRPTDEVVNAYRLTSRSSLSRTFYITTHEASLRVSFFRRQLLEEYRHHIFKRLRAGLVDVGTRSYRDAWVAWVEK